MKFLFACILLVSPALLFASAKDAGCSDPFGVQRNNVLSQNGLVFTNATSSPITTTSMASNTSGCRVSSFASLEDREAGAYLATHSEEIKGEIASGRHEYILGFEDLIGCKGQTNTVVDSIKKNESALQSGFSDVKFGGWLQSLRNQCHS